MRDVNLHNYSSFGMDDMMQTAIIWDEMDMDLKFFVIPGDWRSLDGVYINTTDDIESDELCDLMYEPDGSLKQVPVEKAEFQKAIIDGAFLITAGFIP